MERRDTCIDSTQHIEVADTKENPEEGLKAVWLLSPLTPGPRPCSNRMPSMQAGINPTGCEMVDKILYSLAGFQPAHFLGASVDRRAFTAHTSLSRNKTCVSSFNRRIDRYNAVSKIYFPCMALGRKRACPCSYAQQARESPGDRSPGSLPNSREQPASLHGG